MHPRMIDEMEEPVNRYEKPPWWGSDYGFAWDHIKLEMERRLKAEPEGGLDIISLVSTALSRI